MVKYDDLTTEAKVRCMDAYVFEVCSYDFNNNATIAELEDSIRITLEESEQNGFEIDGEGRWWFYGKRC